MAGSRAADTRRSRPLAALEKLRDERFNSEVAATLATLAPPTIWPTLAVMHGWRAAKAVRATLRREQRSAIGARSATTYLQ